MRDAALSRGRADATLTPPATTKPEVALFNWRDPRHPAAGGAEVLAHDLLVAFSKRGYACTLVAAGAPGLPKTEEFEHYTVVRMGNAITCRLHAAAWLWKRRNRIDVVIDEVNTLPFLSRFIVPKKTTLWIFQVAREVWWYEAPPVVAAIGYLLEPLMLKVYRSSPLITISKSSAESLRAIGLRGDIEIIEVPLPPRDQGRAATVRERIGYVGRLVRSKRVDHIIRAFALVAKTRPNAELWVVGGGSPLMAARLLALAQELGCADRVHFTGYLSNDERDAIVATLDCLAMASVREGWGMVVSEAGRFGVPAVAYDVDGLRDAVVDGSTGLLVSERTPEGLARAMERILSDRALRDRLGENAAAYIEQFSHQTFEDRMVGKFAAAR
jgi:glycosyltransferase involved in cell wall biosynthesis